MANQSKNYNYDVALHVTLESEDLNQGVSNIQEKFTVVEKELSQLSPSFHRQFTIVKNEAISLASEINKAFSKIAAPTFSPSKQTSPIYLPVRAPAPIEPPTPYKPASGFSRYASADNRIQISAEADYTKQKANADKFARESLADISRMENERVKMRNDANRAIETSDKDLTKISISEVKARNNAEIGELKKAESEAKNSSSVFSSVLGASFFGNLGANAVSFFVGQISKLPDLISGIVSKATDLSQERTNAFKGLESISIFKGVDTQSSEEVVKNLRLVKAGVVDVTEASTALKNLLSTGFSLDQAKQILERFSDSAAFGKQAALGFGQAIAGASEGIKNQNSMLVDNVGLTKNISVILKERGFEMQDLSDKTKKQSALDALYKGILAETAAQVGDADKLTQGYTGTISALTTAENSLYASIGNIITQNPEVIAMLKLWTEEITGVTDALNKQDSQQAITFANFLSWIAKSTIKTQNWAEFASAVFQDLFAGFARVASGFYLYLDYAMQKIAATLKFGFDKFTDLYNNFAVGLNAVPATLGLPQLPMIERDTSQGEKDFYNNEKEFADLMQKRDQYFQTEKGWFQKSNQALIAGADRLTEFQFLADDVKNKLKADKENLKKDKPTKVDDDGIVSGGRGRKRTALTPEQRNYRDLERFVRSEGFRVTSTTDGKHNRGSLHYLGRAVDAGAKEKSPDQIGAFIAAALEKGFRVVDERVRPVGQKVWKGAHIHLETNKTRESTLNPALSYGKIPIGLLREKDNARFAKQSSGGIDLKDISAFNTKDEQEKNIRQAIEVYKIAGLIPSGELLDKFRDLMKSDAEKAGTKQPDAQSIVDSFKINSLSKLGAVESQSIIPSTPINPIPTLEEDRIAKLRESLGLVTETYGVEKDRTNEQSRYANLIIRENSMMEEVSVLLEDQAMSRKEATVQAEIDYQVLLRRNIAEEAALGFIQSRNDQLRQLGDIERDLEILREQNADKAFVAQRRQLDAQSEEYDLKKSITSLQDRIANDGANDGYKIYEAHLRDVVELRERELNAVISVNKAQLEMSQAMVISNNQIRAAVFQRLADEANINQSIASGINKTYEALTSVLDKKLDALNNKAKGFLSIITEPLKAIEHNAVSKLFTSVIDSILPPDLAEQFHTTGNPQLDEAKTTNKLLTEIRDGKGGALGNVININNPDQSSGIGGMIGRAVGMIGKLFGIGNLGGGTFGGGNQGNGVFSLGGSNSIGGLGSNLPTGAILNLPNGDQAYNVNGNSGGNPLSSLFSGQGVSSAIASGGVTAAIALAQYALTTKSPIKGLLSGGLVGLAAGFINRSRERRKEEVQRTQFLSDATAGIAQFDQLISDVQNFRIDPPSSALTQGDSLSKSIHDQYMASANSLKDKKTRNIALSEITGLDQQIAVKMDQLRAAVDLSNNANDREKRMIPEFATGGRVQRPDGGIDALMRERGYDSFINRPNGVIPGSFRGRDTVLAAVAPQEVILNLGQQKNLISMLGFDPLKQLAIPGYEGGGRVSNLPQTMPATAMPKTSNADGSSPADSKNQGNQKIVFSPHITIVCEKGEDGEMRIKEIALDAMASNDGIEITKDNIKVLSLSKQI